MFKNSQKESKIHGCKDCTGGIEYNDYIEYNEFPNFNSYTKCTDYIKHTNNKGYKDYWGIKLVITII